MKKAFDIRETFLNFFRSKGHQIVDSAPIVVKDDPTLMFTNAGMNQFKDIFLGHQAKTSSRIADTQKCLRVSGKHNDLEEVGQDSYHHTMFEMLGNWSFGDYFKQEAIDYAYELLVDIYGIDKNKIYVTVFGGDKIDGTEPDEEAADLWARFIPRERILYFGKKDNFWEMGDTGPCGPCSEIHVDLRSAGQRAEIPGKELVNKDHPMVIEIWNLVFIQYNRKKDGSLEELPEKHVDTGMGLERLVMILQDKTSNYDSDLFSPLIRFVEEQTGVEYTSDYSGEVKSDIAMRVIADHIRAVAFTIADGEMPNNTGGGYVIRRILRRAVRYYYSFLGVKEPFIYKMVPLLAEQFAAVFPELKAQETFVGKVMAEEERSFLRTLDDGLKRLNALKVDDGTLSGEDAFELYDTYGFPFDLTRLVAKEKGWRVDEKAFIVALEEQKSRSRADAAKTMGDWQVVHENGDSEFVGYDQLEMQDIRVLKYRDIEEKGKTFHQLVLDKTPFYPEGGGQVGDTGLLTFGQERISVQDTVKENNLIVHYVDRIPENISALALGFVDKKRRKLIENNHTATHLMHSALRTVLGEHVQQKGSLVRDDYLRFDFSHYQKMTDEEISRVELIVNEKIRENIKRREDRAIPLEAAKSAGAMMLFGEKYGDEVRMITFDPGYSVELCGGCHVQSTGQLGYFKITSETGIAAGIRRIVAITSEASESYINDQLTRLNEVSTRFKNPDVVAAIDEMLEENAALKKKLQKLEGAKAGAVLETLRQKVITVNGRNVLAERVDIEDAKAVKTLLFNLEKEISNGVFLLGFVSSGKPQLMLMISGDLTRDGNLHAGKIIKEIAREIKGGGGGQPFFASAGGSDPSGLDRAIDGLKNHI